MQHRRLVVSAAFLAVGVLGALAACDSKKDAAAPTAPVSTPALSASPNVATAIGERVASVCRGYQREQARVAAELAKAPKDAELSRQATAIASMIRTTCE
ncbi:hypothetical protein J421_1281 [Gemmatirosa kalamazoonensis]|uniref:Lipoprotein n=1 Tax=Gemmatirosa kalamazoonensis TaxID=861299 RepID=W0RHE1_9BACT|nr:hypothetical protein [Gemmatirosa kalamazoonensis]AHG88818.1 hypothetical protein J421_1281 [Gemmatirosa kalamazoonensis]